ncbi:uncharacterized protein [Lepeophtheirus salmonis]|uniref:Uncharacterized protein n=1 Tax=Lepeophtheirus salmonis TaxID=72036 RepID=A0A0K2UDM6_LEPSM|nr:uncharacterized protein LOC121118142 [Lepeophtheirus salmonis]
MDRSRGVVLGPISNRRGGDVRSIYPPGYYEERENLSTPPRTKYYSRRDLVEALYPAREDCSCTSVSEEEEDVNEVVLDESGGDRSHRVDISFSSTPSSSPSLSSPSSSHHLNSSNLQYHHPPGRSFPKKKCQLNKLVNHHLHRRHHSEYYGTHFSHPGSQYEHDPSKSNPHPHYSGIGSHIPPHLHPSPSTHGGHSYSSSAHKTRVPHYLENIIQNSHNINKPQHDAKLMKKLSKCIIIPENPEDPAAFTVTPGFTGTPKPPWCSSKPVQKIVGTFVILMSLGILAAVLYVSWSSNTFRPMMK